MSEAGAWRRSSRCSDASTACVEVAWRKSSRSGSHNTSCVEVGWLAEAEAERALVRDSKYPEGGALGFSRVDWLRLLRGVGS